MQRFASVRFDGVLAPSERDAATRAIVSAGATVTSWNACEARTYATVSLAGDVSALRDAVDGIVDEPPLLVVRVTPTAPRFVAALAHALGGSGRPAGVVAAHRSASDVVVECDPRVTSLATLVALVDCELVTAPGRRIEPLVGIDDATLVAFAAVVLGEPDLEPSRLLEPHLADALAAARA